MNRNGLQLLLLASLGLIGASAVAHDAAAGPRPSRPIPTPRVAFYFAGQKFEPEVTPAKAHTSRRTDKGADTSIESAEARAAIAIDKLLTKALKPGVTSVFVADARTGAPVFTLRPDDEVNPASNLKLVSTAAAIEALGADYRYTTLVIGPPADAAGTIHGDVYVLGSYDPTFDLDDVEAMADDLAKAGVHRVQGGIVVGESPTRDGIYRAKVAIAITATAPGEPITVVTPDGYDMITVVSTATTTKKKRGQLAFTETTYTDERGEQRINLTIGGTLARGKTLTHWVWPKERALHAGHALEAALRRRQIDVAGIVGERELTTFIGQTFASGWIPLPLATHRSQTLAAIVTQVNKRSINWLADRVVMTAAAAVYGGAPSMGHGTDLMYAWLARHTGHGRDDTFIDTGSGLSYRTRISPRTIVDVIRAAGGLAAAAVAPAQLGLAHAWMSSLSIGGVDGTLRKRFRNTEVAGRLIGKTGTLSTVVALSGILDLDPEHPLVFSIVTNNHAPQFKAQIRKAHESVIGVLCAYLHETGRVHHVPRPQAAPAAPKVEETAPETPGTDDPDDVDGDETEPGGAANAAVEGPDAPAAGTSQPIAAASAD